MSAEYLAAEEHTLEIHADDSIELLLGNVEKRCRGVDARTVDDDVDAAGALKNRSQQRFELRFAARFGGVKPATAAGRFYGAEPDLGFFLASADEHHFGAGAGEAFSHCAAQLAGASDNDGNFAGERKERAQIVSGRRGAHKSRILHGRIRATEAL